jgi:hypothetical protein
MAVTTRREEVAFPSAPDPRFGGNMARANVGKQYSRAFPGGPPGVDRRYENYQAPHRVDYTSPRPPQSTGTPNFREPFKLPYHLTDEYQQWRQSIDPSNRVTTPRQHPNPRMRGMGGGLGGLQEKSQLRRPEDFTNLGMLGRPDLSFKYSHMGPSEGMGVGGKGETRWSDYTVGGTGGWDDDTIRGTWRRMQDARRADEMDEYGYLEGAPRQRTTFTEGYISPQAFNEMYGGVYDDAIFRTVDPNTNRIEQYPQAGESEQSKVNLQEIMNRMPWMNPWRLIQNLDARGIEYANRGGLMSLRR